MLKSNKLRNKVPKFEAKDLDFETSTGSFLIDKNGYYITDINGKFIFEFNKNQKIDLRIFFPHLKDLEIKRLKVEKGDSLVLNIYMHITDEKIIHY